MMNTTIEQLYLDEYDRLGRARQYVYDVSEQAPDLAINASGVLRAHGRLLNQLMNSAAYLEYELQKSKDLVDVLKERVMFLEEQLDAVDRDKE